MPQNTKNPTKRDAKSTLKKVKKLVATLAVMSSILSAMPATQAAPPPGSTTAPYTVSYSARLTNAGGTPVTTTQDVRFSLWSDADFDATDLLGSGSIDTGAAGYAGWEETHTITPDSNGLFQVRLGTINTLPNFATSTHIFLEVDVKTTLAPLTSFEVLDPDGNTANVTDRFPLDSSAFAINSDTLDNRDAGTNPGEIPFLDGTGLLPISTIPGGTNGENFILDNDNTIVGPGSIKLQFGNTLAKFLEYDNLLSWFNFNDDVNITGNLTTTGTINGVTVNSTTVGPYNQSIVYEPLYADSVIQPDGTTNSGKLEELFIDTDGAPGNNNMNYYHWSTLKPTLQDVDLVIRPTIPEGFVAWQATPIQFTFRTGTALVGDNQVDISVEDTAGNPVTLTGASTLVGTAFTTTSITFGGAPTFTPGQPITIHVKLTAKSSGSADAARLQLNYNGR
ncbi:MAG: hypothetical protein U0519_00315 [Candidatus Gracilibacteria bacterium]